MRDGSIEDKGGNIHVKEREETSMSSDLGDCPKHRTTDVASVISVVVEKRC